MRVYDCGGLTVTLRCLPKARGVLLASCIYGTAYILYLLPCNLDGCLSKTVLAFKGITIYLCDKLRVVIEYLL